MCPHCGRVLTWPDDDGTKKKYRVKVTMGFVEGVTNQPVTVGLSGWSQAAITIPGLQSLVIVGALLAIFWSVWVGIIVVLVGLIAFGGFARGRWY